MDNQAPSMLKPALIAGLTFGIAGAIPIIEYDQLRLLRPDHRLRLSPRPTSTPRT